MVSKAILSFPWLDKTEDPVNRGQFKHSLGNLCCSRKDGRYRNHTISGGVLKYETFY